MEQIIVAFESEKTALRVKELLEGGGAGRLPRCAAPPTRCGGP